MPDFVETSDRLMSRVLKASQVRREHFDPANLEHQESLSVFLATGNWGEVQFFVEQPYVTVPETVLRMFAAYSLENFRNGKRRSKTKPSEAVINSAG
mgnify:CR=1 FL=1